MRLPNIARGGLRQLDNAVDNGLESVLLMTRTVITRSSSSDSSSTSSNACSGDNANSAECQKPTSSNSETLPIVLGAVIPITFALVVFFILHRRYLKKQRLEDRDDPHKSLDFGMDLQLGSARKGGKPIPEMTITDMGHGGPSRSKRAHGMSMDMGLGSPYLLPGGLQDSRESIHSMSRSLKDEHDPYHPVTLIRSSTESGRPPRVGDNGSVYSAATSHQSGAESAKLLTNAQRMSRTIPFRADSMSPRDTKDPQQLPLVDFSGNSRNASPSRNESLALESQSPALAPMNFSVPDRKSLPAPPPVPSKSPNPDAMPLPARTSSAVPPPPRKSSAAAGRLPPVPSIGRDVRESSNYGDDDFARNIPSVPTFNINEPRDSEYDVDGSMISTGRYSIEMTNPSQQYPAPAAPNRLSMMGVRPLPPDNLLAEENPEHRANRIRSFYKEYFDDSKNTDGDWDAGYSDGAIYDPATGSFVIPGRPFAQGVGRRAMTPPPRGAPRFSGNDSHQRRMSTMTGARGRPGPGGSAPQITKKKLPPPKDLLGLPTPHKMGYDNAIASPIDFAPPTTFRDVQKGLRPDSPSRPYSPAVRAFTPLASSFDQLQVMPSPHQIRSSGTFTTLDFAPPRFKTEDTSSDAGSIRSARSGISARQMNAVRAGAYRVSRIPKEVVTSREDMAAQLRPKMDLVTRA